MNTLQIKKEQSCLKWRLNMSSNRKFKGNSERASWRNRFGCRDAFTPAVMVGKDGHQSNVSSNCQWSLDTITVYNSRVWIRTVKPTSYRFYNEPQITVSLLDCKKRICFGLTYVTAFVPFCTFCRPWMHFVHFSVNCVITFGLCKSPHSPEHGGLLTDFHPMEGQGHTAPVGK